MTILDEIVAYKRDLLAQGYYEDKLQSLTAVDVSHKQTLNEQIKSSKELAIIAEIKSKSPSIDRLPERNLIQQVKQYEQYGANAVSILTDEQYFEGSFERLQELTIETNLPVLCKDFIVEKIQIDVARKAGASIILLIVNVLNDEELKELYHYAQSLNLEVLVEVHDKAELKRAHQLGAELIGINNRDLKRFVTDVLHTNEILEDYQPNVNYISESGIRKRSDVENIVASGISGMLIGESLMTCDDLSQFLPSLKLKKVQR